jgi:polyhydroxybutyrate depolymerase
MRAMTRRAFLALTVGVGAATLSGGRSARAGAASQPAVVGDPGAGRARANLAGRSVERLPVGGVERRYVRYGPPGLDPAAIVPLVLMLHGRGGSGSIAEWMYDWREQSDAHGFVVAYPDALGDPPTWHAGVGLGGRQQDDVDFVRALVEREASARPIDRSRVFVCGHSNGGMMAYRLAAEASDLFAAAGVVAGTAGFRGPGGQIITIQQPARPIPIIHFHGTDDRLVPYDGGGDPRWPGGFFSVADSIAFWVAANGCDPTPTTETVGVARRETYTNTATGAEVTLWTVEGGGHAWPKPQTPVSPPGTTADISATELTWAFFAAHPRGTVSRTSSSTSASRNRSFLA